MAGRNLDRRLSELIAERDGINPEDVSVAYIHEQRKRYVYPKARYPAPFGLHSFTGEELAKIDRIADKILAAL